MKPADAFETELLEIAPQVRRFAYYLTRDATRAEDLAQDAMAKAWDARDSFTLGTNMKAWVFFIARNHFLTERRRAWRTVEMAEGQAEALPVEPSALHGVLLKEALQAVSYLPRQQFDAFEAVVLDGLTYEDAAQQLGIEIGSVKSQVSRARDALAIYFSAGG